MANKKRGKLPLIYVLDRLLVLSLTLLVSVKGVTSILRGDLTEAYVDLVTLNMYYDFIRSFGDYEYDTKGVSGWRM